jgi:hypothetical protein
MTVMMSLSVRPNCPLSTFAKGKLHANAANLEVVACISLKSNEMGRREGVGGEAGCGNAQQRFVANRNTND